MLRAVIELIYPPRLQCPLCGAQSPDNSLCLDCRQLLDGYAGEQVCCLCGGFLGVRGYHLDGLVYPTPGDSALLREQPPGYEDKLISCGSVNRLGASLSQSSWLMCPACRAENRPFDLARAVAPYEGPVREAVQRLKYRGMKSLAVPLGELMANASLREGAFARTDALVPVPMHPGRERERGYNQSVLLARALGELLQVPVLERVLVKIRETPSQTSLSASQRRKNLQQAFVVAKPEPVKGKILTIIDDVFTTGSTVSIISHLLRQAGARSVLVLTFAGTRQSGKK
ncbi:ComF family protein [Desulfoscipio gibsoniae]|uniref:Putative amidophosphoribosyltransferase n=1 Tax=Desulfoscipio gibsoniae DSM 7213 TaxID=767817 RepID=R4KLP2_9FIRM|nr:ComF family protein [Desulfoscipio gibsoniae]AGL03584.1 putative amidophosphoribosyltransferase [Desulfoscipio gibsoniae DSM 7213]